MARTTDRERHADLAIRGLRVALRRGAIDLSMSTLAAELGVKRSTLYHYFGSVDELLDIASATVAERMRADLAAAATVDHPVVHLADTLGAFAELAADPAARTVLQRIDLAAETFGDRAVERLRAAISDGLAVPCDAEVVVALCRVTATGIVAAGAGALDGRRVVAEVVAKVLEPLRLESWTEHRSENWSEIAPEPESAAPSATKPGPFRRPKPSSAMSWLEVD